MILVIARELGKFEWEVLQQCPPDELARWIALRNIEYKEKQKQERKQAARANRVGRKRRR